MLTALRYPDFRLLLAGWTVGSIGAWMQTFGLGWLVIEIAVREGTPANAPFYLGLVGLARAVPGLALGLLGGAITDRVPPLPLLRRSQFGGAATALFLGALALTGTVELWAVLILTAVQSAVLSIEGPPKTALIPRLVPREEVLSAVGANGLAYNSAQIVGPAIGGLLIGPLGIGGMLVLSAGGYAAVIAVTYVMKPQPAAGPRSTSLVHDMVEGVRYMRRDPVIRGMIVIACLVAFFGRPYTFLLPAFAANSLHLDAAGLSLLMSATGVGAVIGAFITSSLGRIRRQGLIVIWSTALVGLAVLAFSLQRNTSGAAAAAVAVGIAMLVYNGLQNGVFTLASHAHMLGRVSSVINSVWLGVLPLGQLALGTLGAVTGIDVALAVGGICTLGVAAYSFLYAPAIRALTTERHPHFHGATDASGSVGP